MILREAIDPVLQGFEVPDWKGGCAREEPCAYVSFLLPFMDSGSNPPARFHPIRPMISTARALSTSAWSWVTLQAIVPEDRGPATPSTCRAGHHPFDAKSACPYTDSTWYSRGKPMNAIRIEKVLEKDGELHLSSLPCKKGDRVEAIVLIPNGSASLEQGEREREEAVKRFLQRARASRFSSIGKFPSRDELHERS